MAQVKVSINSRNYDIVCGDGEEDHVVELGRFVDGKVARLVSSVGQVGDTRLLVMAALLVADELSEAYRKLESGVGPEGDAASGADGGSAAHLEAMARRIDDIAASLERA